MVIQNTDIFDYKYIIIIGTDTVTIDQYSDTEYRYL